MNKKLSFFLFYSDCTVTWHQQGIEWTYRELNQMYSKILTSTVTTFRVTPCMPCSARFSLRLPFNPRSESHVASWKTARDCDWALIKFEMAEMIAKKREIERKKKNWTVVESQGWPYMSYCLQTLICPRPLTAEQISAALSGFITGVWPFVLLLHVQVKMVI